MRAQQVVPKRVVQSTNKVNVTYNAVFKLEAFSGTLPDDGYASFIPNKKFSAMCSDDFDLGILPPLTHGYCPTIQKQESVQQGNKQQSLASRSKSLLNAHNLLLGSSMILDTSLGIHRQRKRATY